MNPAIDVRKLNYHYDKSRVLNDLSFTVGSGDFFIIIGPNGSGKTTLLKSIIGISRSSVKDIYIFNRPLEDYDRKDLARTVAYVPQAIPVDFSFTVKEFVLMGRSPHLGLLGIEEKRDIELAKSAMEFTEVYHLSHRRIDQLSGGECQRVFIARAICQDSKILLLDEPNASLDLAHQVRVMDLMEKLKKDRQTTIVMVSHDINLAAMYSDRLLLLKNGKKIAAGSPKRVLNFKTLENAYDCNILVDESPMGKLPRITLIPGKYADSSDRQ